MDSQERGRLLKELGMQRALDGADEEWVRSVYWVFWKFNQIGTETFTADDIREVLEAAGVETRNPNAIGGIFSRLAKKGIIERIRTRQKTSKREETRNRTLGVWRFKDHFAETPEMYATKLANKMIEKHTSDVPKECRKVVRRLIYRACLLGTKWGREQQ